MCAAQSALSHVVHAGSVRDLSVLVRVVVEAFTFNIFSFCFSLLDCLIISKREFYSDTCTASRRRYGVCSRARNAVPVASKWVQVCTRTWGDSGRAAPSDWRAGGF